MVIDTCRHEKMQGGGKVFYSRNTEYLNQALYISYDSIIRDNVQMTFICSSDR